ncbi:MAG: hypothetical protein ACRD1W_18170 [Vicinamibacterales bacterium]
MTPHHALVMEIVDGPTLADRIGTSRMPIGEVIAVARQIVDALAYAASSAIAGMNARMCCRRSPWSSTARRCSTDSYFTRSNFLPMCPPA